MKKLLMTAVSLSLLAGCIARPVTDQQDDPIVKALTGQSSGYAKEKLGLPNVNKVVASGATVWIYRDVERGMAANECKVSLSIRNDKIERVTVSSEALSLFSAAFTPCEHIRAKLM